MINKRVNNKINSPHPVRSSFLNYLRSDFVYKLDWTHPETNEVFNHELIKEKLTCLKELNPRAFKLLWALWTTQKSISFFTERFLCSQTAIKRAWSKGIDTVLLMLIYPDLDPGIINIYNYNEV